MHVNTDPASRLLSPTSRTDVARGQGAKAGVSDRPDVGREPAVSPAARQEGSGQLSLPSLVENWGTAKGREHLDFNGDGSINQADVLGFLHGILEAWGTDETQFDLNNDGTVDDADLTAFLHGGPGHGPEAVAPETLPEPVADREPTAVAGPTPPQSAAEQARLMSDGLIERLERAGFEKSPPVNIRSIIDAIDFAPDQKAHMLQALMARYPDGLGVDLLG